MCLFSYSGSCHFLCGSHPGGVSELSELEEELEVLVEDDDMGEEEDPAAGLFEPTAVAPPPPPPTPEEPPLSFSPST